MMLHNDASLQAANPSPNNNNNNNINSNNSLLSSLSFLKGKVHQLHSSVVNMILVSDYDHQDQLAMATASVGSLVQEIIVTASSLMVTGQQFSISNNNNNNNETLHHQNHDDQFPRSSNSGSGPEFYFNDAFGTWYSAHNNNNNNNNYVNTSNAEDCIIELDATNLLAKYTHYCQVCGKGFKRDANLRMHMRAHGDEYKSIAALRRNSDAAISSSTESNNNTAARKLYSCPQEGCRWNRKHAKFQPLKSMICVKNHYKRSHCPKMYVCKRCNGKQFSVLSDLRTHEKHCGDSKKWLCSCGTTFSRKDKLMAHVALFVGHTPAVTSSARNKKLGQDQVAPMQLDM